MNESGDSHRPIDGTDDSKPRVVIHAAYPLWRKHLLVEVARAKELQDEGCDVVMTYCAATRGTCAANYFGNPVVCKICRTRAKSTAQAAGLPLVPLDVPAGVSTPDVTEDQRAQLREGVQSGITSAFRSLPGDSGTSGFIQRSKQRYLRTAESLLHSMKHVIAQFQPQRIEVFSGRHACARFAVIAARSAGIEFNTLEITATKRPIIFVGHTPHDRKNIQRRILHHPVNDEQAEEFYRRRRQPRHNRHTKGQTQTFTAPSAEGYRKKVAIFLSSQDEFEALGSEWRSAFDDYPAVVQELCERHPETLFCVRFHPNQGDMTSDVVSPFAKIATRDNVRIYYPDDSVNTYGLIQWSDLVITFGSTVTVEACWMGKPVVLLGRSFFDDLNVAYTPESMAQVHPLLEQDLEPLDRSGAARFASYFLTDGDSLKYIREGKLFEADGFRLAHPVLGRIARIADNVLCNVVKIYMASNLQRRMRKAG